VTKAWLVLSFQRDIRLISTVHAYISQRRQCSLPKQQIPQLQLSNRLDAGPVAGVEGAAGVAGAAFVVLAATLGSVGTVPVESVALILGVHRLMSEGLTPTNVVGNAVATIVVAKWERALDERRLQQVLDGNASESNLAQS
jgi:sodium:dicarboxylate symporter family protein